MTRDFLTKTGYWTLDDNRPVVWQQLYPNVNVELELGRAAQWLEVEVSRRKTPHGMLRFLLSWIKRAEHGYSGPTVRRDYAALSSVDRAVCAHEPRCSSPGNWQCQQRTVLEQARKAG